jgi:hypothetical protein
MRCDARQGEVKKRCEYAVLVLMLLLPDQTLGLCFGADHTLDAKVCT